MDAAKTNSKRAVQKTAEATVDLIGNKILHKITSGGKSKSKKREQNNEMKETQEIYIPPKRWQQNICN